MQTQIVKQTKTEEKIDKMCAYAAHNCKLLSEQITYLKKQQDGWFAAYHTLRSLNDVGRETKLTEKQLELVLEEYAKNTSEVLAALIAVGGRK